MPVYQSKESEKQKTTKIKHEITKHFLISPRILDIGNTTLEVHFLKSYTI